MKALFEADRLVNTDSDPVLVWEAMVSQAVNARVSDIHVLAQKTGYDIAFRIDGDYRPQGRVDADFARRMVNHIKSVAGIDVGEHRRPSEGHMRIHMDGRTVELRVSVVPSTYGQDLVARVFDRTLNLLDLEDLGLLDEQLDQVRDMISRPHGLILVTGPTGGGKTTSLYAILQHLVGKGRKIVTIEDPVEYDLTGVNQTEVNPRIDVTFARMLTAVMRQDPDIIMIGEIRDEQTAHTAVRAANTGHLVLATTHASRAARAVESLLSLGVHPYFLGSALRGVIAQVLVKRLCPHCSTVLDETAEMILEPSLKARLGDRQAKLYQGSGCEHCYRSGYSGRMGLFELLAPDAALRQMIFDRVPADQLEQASSKTQLTLEQVGKLAAVTGQTTMEEIIDKLPMV